MRQRYLIRHYIPFLVTFFFFFNIFLGGYDIFIEKNMKKTYHLCLSGGNEVMYRSKDDYIRGINSLCMAAHKTGSSLLAYAIMSNHVHICVRTEDPTLFMTAYRYPYNRYFNSKYKRRGSLGEIDYFELEVEGLNHLLTAVAYILRNPMHHGITSTPFGYAFSSVNAIFREELGRQPVEYHMPKKSQYQYISGREKLPSGFLMNTEGMILPETVIDIADLQHQFSTARTYIYYLNRLSGDAWIKEQFQDNNGLEPISIETIEKGINYQDLRSMLANEYGRANYKSLNDIQLCDEIDRRILPKYFSGRTVYELSQSEHVKICEYLVRTFHVPLSQIERCLGIAL